MKKFLCYGCDEYNNYSIVGIYDSKLDFYKELFKCILEEIDFKTRLTCDNLTEKRFEVFVNSNEFYFFKKHHDSFYYDVKEIELISDSEITIKYKEE